MEKQDIFRFVKRTLLFFLAVFLVDFAVGQVMRYFYFRQDSGSLYRTTYALDSTTAQVLVLGSSRASRHYNPDVMQVAMNRTVYNAGQKGNHIFYHYGILKGVLRRYKPQVVVLDILYDEFKPVQDSYDRLSVFLPYHDTHPELEELINLRSPFEPVKLVSKVYPYNSLILPVLNGNLGFDKVREPEIKGYLPIDAVMTDSVKKRSERIEYGLDSLKLQTFEEIMSTCKKEGINLYVVFSPAYLENIGNNYSVSIARKIASEQGVPFLDFSGTEPFVSDNKLYSDNVHLNAKGADIFSRQVADSIANRLKNQN
ncbi:hypothetical protein ACFSQD_06425 [Flavihumibacter stibioxidans]|uniref:SGNH hydrolase-type esterase domain-containing protein n=1 Tax=Flavihumibacter stibioxidans TaxID=1834163 RepID=A0ABR7M4K9_9BACT|nr:hypothetical protein [Flavihumibacter stibioxidans]MBC6489943.1 hypothetical protein [Flavihumibacter stibioxidans]